MSNANNIVETNFVLAENDIEKARTKLVKTSLVLAENDIEKARKALPNGISVSFFIRQCIKRLAEDPAFFAYVLNKNNTQEV